MTVVVADLPTPEGREALTFALAEARRRRAPLVVVSGDGGEEASATKGVGGPGDDVRVETGTGDLAEDLVAVSEKEQAELVVIGLRQRSPVGKLILGSKAQRILLEAPCPVLAVKLARTDP